MPQRRVHGPERKRKNWGVQAEGLSGEWRVAAAVSLMDPSGLHTATVRRGQSAGAGRRSVPGPAGLLPTPPARLSRFVVRACLRALSRKPPPNRTASATAQGPLQVQGLTKSAHPGAEGGSTPQALPNFNEEIQEKSSRQGVSRSASSPTAQLGVGPPHTSCRNEVTPAGDASVWSEERQVFRVTLRTLPPPPGPFHRVAPSPLPSPPLKAGPGLRTPPLRSCRRRRTPWPGLPHHCRRKRATPGMGGTPSGTARWRRSPLSETKGWGPCSSFNAAAPEMAAFGSMVGVFFCEVGVAHFCAFFSKFRIRTSFSNCGTKRHRKTVAGIVANTHTQCWFFPVLRSSSLKDVNEGVSFSAKKGGHGPLPLSVASKSANLCFPDWEVGRKVRRAILHIFTIFSMFTLLHTRYVFFCAAPFPTESVTEFWGIICDFH